MLTINESSRGKLIAINDFSALPFVPQRFMYIHDVPNKETRGFHAHKTNTQFLICLQGRIIIKTITTNHNTGLEETAYELRANEYILMPSMTWGEQTYFDNASALVLCSKEYDEQDYIRDYEEFKKS